MFQLKFFLLLSCTCLLLLSKAVNATPKPNNDFVEPPEFVNVHSKYFDIAKRKDSTAWSGIKQVLIKEPTLDFSSYWLREHKHDMTKSDETRLKTSYTQALKQSLEDAFNRSGWEIVSSPTEGTLVITPMLSDVRIQAPELSLRPMTRDYVTHVGAARIKLMFAVGDEAHQVGLLEDHDETRSMAGLGDLKKTDRVTNYRDFKFLFQKWSKRAAEFVGDSSQAKMVSMAL